MEQPRSKGRMNPLILEEATTWFIDFNSGASDSARRTEFNDWLRRSPEHMQAYLQVSSVWEGSDVIGRGRADFDAVVARARNEVNVYSLDVAREEAAVFTREETWERPTGSRLRPWLLAMAASLLIVVGTSMIVWHSVYGVPTYSTEIGEQSSLVLDDGSAVELNARSRMRVRFTQRERSVELLAGQALFRVAKDATRPFVVIAGGTRVRAVGTTFDVYRKSTGTVVTVVEGKVLVERQGSPAAESGTGSAVGTRSSSQAAQTSADAAPSRADEWLVSAGEQMRVHGADLEAPKPANLPMAMAWTQKELVFDSTPLREVVEEFNRYNRRQMAIRDAGLDDFHISGVFPSTDSTRIIQFLRRRFGVTVGEDGDVIEIRRAEAGVR